MQNGRYLSKKEIANKLGWTPRQIQRHVNEGDMPHIRKGQQLRFKESEVEEWMDKDRQGWTEQDTSK